jgi:hypothetical protein
VTENTQTSIFHPLEQSSRYSVYQRTRSKFQPHGLSVMAADGNKHDSALLRKPWISARLTDDILGAWSYKCVTSGPSFQLWPINYLASASNSLHQ